jgi:hypothetical protein
MKTRWTCLQYPTSSIPHLLVLASVESFIYIGNVYKIMYVLVLNNPLSSYIILISDIILSDILIDNHYDNNVIVRPCIKLLH